MAQASTNRMEMPLVTARDSERLLARLIGIWAAVGLVLAAFWGVLVGALSVLAVGFWIGYALAGTVLALFAVASVRGASSSRVVGLALAVSVPAVAAGLWGGAGLLRACGDAFVAMLRAI
jgi:hypothetical protein